MYEKGFEDYKIKIGYWYQILYQEAADGECYFEEKEPCFANFYCNPDDYKSIFSEKKRAFENLEYELKVENMLNNYQAPPEDFVKNRSFFSFFSKSNLNISSYDPPKLINHLKVSNKVKRRIVIHCGSISS